MSFLRYYLRPMLKHWRTTWKLLTSYAKSEEFEWSEITVDDLFDRVNSDQPPLLIDVRSPKEFNGGYGHIPNARPIPVLDLESNFDALQSFKEKFGYTSGENVDDIPFRSGKAISQMELEKT